MKKSVFTLLAIAFAVITMSSCSKDDAGSSNSLNLPEQTQTSKTAETNSDIAYQYQASVSDDLLDLVDVTITRTVAGKTTTYSLCKSDSMQKIDEDGNVIAQCSIKTMDLDIFRASKGENVTIKATATPKANWQSILDAKTKDNIDLAFGVVTGELNNQTAAQKPFVTHIGFDSKSKVTQEVLDSFIDAMLAFFDYNNAK